MTLLKVAVSLFIFQQPHIKHPDQTHPPSAQGYRLMLHLKQSANIENNKKKHICHPFCRHVHCTPFCVLVSLPRECSLVTVSRTVYPPPASHVATIKGPQNSKAMPPGCMLYTRGLAEWTKWGPLPSPHTDPKHRPLNYLAAAIYDSDSMKEAKKFWKGQLPCFLFPLNNFWVIHVLKRSIYGCNISFFKFLKPGQQLVTNSIL